MLSSVLSDSNSTKSIADLLSSLDSSIFPFQRHAAVPVHQFAAYDSMSRIFFRFPDGFSTGDGYPATNYTSLRKLYDQRIPSLHPIDNSNTAPPWTLKDLTEALSTMITLFKPSVVHLQDWFTPDADVGFNLEHADHVFGARIALAAVKKASSAKYRPHVWSYSGYSTQTLPADLNLDEAGTAAVSSVAQALEWKTDAFYAYAAHDDELPCREEQHCKDVNDVYWIWLQRQYFQKDMKTA